MADRNDTTTPPRALPGLLFRLAGLVALVVALHFAVEWALERAAASAHAEMLTFGLVALLVVAYALLIAVPFVPGIEIGLSLIALRGSEVAPIIYVATVTGLMLAFVAGYRLPLAWLGQRLRDVRLTRAADFVDDIRPMSPERRLSLLRSHLPARLAPFAGTWRYALLALLVNLPGSGLIGGGGGICLLAGLTGLFRPRATLLTLAIAVAPLPLFVWATGMDPGWLFSPR